VVEPVVVAVVEREMERWRRRPRKVEDSVERGYGLLGIGIGCLVVRIKSSTTRRRLRPRWASAGSCCAVKSGEDGEERGFVGGVGVARVLLGLMGDDAVWGGAEMVVSSSPPWTVR
jgi:hypothetical protein